VFRHWASRPVMERQMNKPWDKFCGGCGAKMLCDDGDPDFRDDPECGYCSKCFAAWETSRTPSEESKPRARRAINLVIGATYTSGSLLHQRQVLSVEGDKLTYRVISSHAQAVIGSTHECFLREFEKWAKREVSAPIAKVA